MKKSLLPIVLLYCPFIGIAQPGTPPELTYEQRIQRKKLDNVYIPGDLNDAFTQLKQLMEPAALQKFKEMPEDAVMPKLYFSFGRWITKNWSFYEGSRFSHYLKGIGLHNPDDMVHFVMVTYHRHVNEKPLDIKALAITLKENRAAQDKERKLKGEILHQETRKRQD